MKGYRDNGGATGGFGARNKTVYDDVFGGPPKFGATTLPPRLEDYTEIFQGFHASRGSSIPVLDLPPPSNEPGELWLDVQSSKLDYSEVFGGFNGLDFAVSYEKLFKSSKAADGDSSDDIWTPAQSESLSDDLDPYTSLEINQHVSTSDPIELYGITNDSQFHEIENEKLFTLANNDHSSSNHSERKQLKKSFSQPLDNVYDTERYYGSDYKDYRIENKKPHISVSDVSLKTQPSNLPPPSRPPPVLSSKKGDDVCLSSKLKTSRSYGFEKMKSDRSPPYFDVEIDASSSAAVDAMKDAVEQAQAKLKSAKELKDRKKGGFQNRSKSNVGGKTGNVTNGVVGINEKIPVESFEQKEDFKNVPEREVCELEEKNERQEKLDSGHEEIKEPICEPRGVETSFVDSHEHAETKTPSEVDESDNLIEIQLKNNDMEPVVEEIVVENDKNTPYEWEEYGEAFEKEHEKEVKESKEEDLKEGQNPVPPEIIITQIEEEEDENGDESEEHEIIYEDLFHSEDNKNEEKLDHNETNLEEKDVIKGLDADVANEEIETSLHEKESSESQKDDEKEEESEKMEEVNSENDVVEKEEELTKEEEVVDQELSFGSKNEGSPQAPFPSNLEGEKIEVKKPKNVKVKEETRKEKEKEREKMEKEREKEKERLRKLEEERERQIEREKDRRATLEARERETKERERATAEFRQRALAEARERLEKACAEARERSLADKALEGRMRVEKATAEARERAERSVDEKFSGSRTMGLRFSQNNAPTSYNGGEDESPQRCKARLERHQRTADRAAKALAEKNMRDLLAQKEQAERNRLAEGLDVEVKRWCSGKQGNLRALLSTLQYILGPDSGWQPVPLTEVITTAAVKKAYRKATLCVHPDKLQQRGATIQQKYICEKVFDLLKEAWNKFNSEER